MKEKNKFHILIVDDEKVNIQLASAYLKEDNYKIFFSLNGASALRIVKNSKIDLILLDINMPKQDGFEICKILKEDQDPSIHNIPVVFLTAQTDIEYISKAFEVGGIDYINKPFNGLELKARVKTHIQSMTYMRDSLEKQSKLAKLSITDNITKLHNSLYFDTVITTKIKEKEDCWVIYILLEHFDKINQHYGFDASNKLLKHFGNTFNDSLNDAIVFRLYGISFGAIIKDRDERELQKLMNNLFINLSEHKKLKDIIHFHSLAINLKKHNSVPSVYKKLQTSMKTLKDANILTPKIF